MPFFLHLPIAGEKSPLKKRKAPSANGLRAAAAQLDVINSLATKPGVSRFKEMFSSDSEDGDEEKSEYEYEYKDIDTDKKGNKEDKKGGKEDEEGEDEDKDVHEDMDVGMDIDKVGDEQKYEYVDVDTDTIGDEESEDDSDNDGRRHLREDIPEIRPKDNAPSRRYEKNRLANLSATSPSRYTEPIEKRARKHTLLLSSDNKLEETTQKSYHTLKRPGTAKDKYDSFASEDESYHRNPFKKTRLAY